MRSGAQNGRTLGGAPTASGQAALRSDDMRVEMQRIS